MLIPDGCKFNGEISINVAPTVFKMVCEAAFGTRLQTGL